ncbi:hypothetical protein EON64_00400 [archaeon]|nr:MAG: hypothetical protein EON64_00400 [archaeon]
MFGLRQKQSLSKTLLGVLRTVDMSDILILRHACKGKKLARGDVALSYAVKRINIFETWRDCRTVSLVTSSLDSTGPRESKDHDIQFAAYNVPWVLNDQHSACMRCKTAFGRTKWRHHCRLCGFLVCDKCSSKAIKINIIRNGILERKGSRICDNCYKS